MAGKILIISYDEAFMANALETNMKKAGFTVTQTGPLADSIKKSAPDTDIFVLFAGDFVNRNQSVVNALNDVCSDRRKHLCVVGYDGEISSIKKVIPAGLISGIFARPFDMNSLIQKMQSLTKEDLRKEDEDNRIKHILLVDDDITFLTMMQNCLSEKYKVTSVKSSMQALGFVASQTPDLILLDYEMPVTDGPEMLKALRSSNGTDSIPVIFLTGKSDRESVMKVMSMKPNGYLLKTMSNEEIMDYLHEFFVTINR